MTITGRTMPKVISIWTSLGLSYVFCTFVSKKNLIFYAVRYLLDSFVEKNVPFNRLVSKNYIKWYTLRNIATRSSLEDQPTQTESSSNYPIHLLVLVVRLIRIQITKINLLNYASMKIK